jgi:DNA-binding beta-propeller fold protein YncE
MTEAKTETETADVILEPAVAMEPATSWNGLLSEAVEFGGDANAVATDSAGRIIVFNRGPVPVLVFNRQERLLFGWGEGEFVCPHAVTVDGDDNLYLVDSRGGHVVHKRTLDGEPLMTLGVRGQASSAHSGDPFNSPTDVAVHPQTRDLYITDGYANSAVHRFDAHGNHIQSWGEPGSGPGQFYLPHSIAVLDSGHVIVCDRENFRLQIFTCDGRFVDQWHAFRPCAVTIHPVTGHIYVAELGPERKFHGQPNLGSRVRILTADGSEVASIGASRPGHGSDQFFAPHSMAFTTDGALLVAEVATTWARDYLGLEVATSEPISLKKWNPVDVSAVDR